MAHTVKKYQDGITLDHTPSSALTAGNVVLLGDRVTVAVDDIAANVQGAVHARGVFEFPKATGASTAIALDANVYWDVAEEVAKADSETGANKFIGRVVKAAIDDDATVLVDLQPVAKS